MSSEKVIAEGNLDSIQVSHVLYDPATLRKSDNLSRPKVKKIIKWFSSRMKD